MRIKYFTHYLSPKHVSITQLHMSRLIRHPLYLYIYDILRIPNSFK